MNRVRVSTTLDAPVPWVVEQLQSTAVFRHITAPLLRFTPVEGAWPERWAPGGTLVLRMALFGVLPLGRQTVRIRLEAPAGPGGWPVLHDAGDGQRQKGASIVRQFKSEDDGGQRRAHCAAHHRRHADQRPEARIPERQHCGAQRTCRTAHNQEWRQHAARGSRTKCDSPDYRLDR